VLDSIAARNPQLIVKFGGHAMAAGLTLELAKLDQFARAFDEEVTRCERLSGRADGVETDGELTLGEIALETAQALREGGPWGQAFPEPCFDGVFTIRNARIVAERHLRLWVEVPRSGRAFEAIAFNCIEGGTTLWRAGDTARLVYRLDINEFNGERRLQLVVEHILPP
jgi:single-stranded-DNA-specific exonuclease